VTLPLPTSLTPSKMASFKSCGLAFRFSVIDRIPETPSPWAVRGTLVHRALQLLHSSVEAGGRTPGAASSCLAVAWEEMASDPEFTALELGPADAAEMLDAAGVLVGRCFELEDPNAVHAIGLELRLEAEIGGVVMRGIIDRLELDADGDLVITDYKTGRAPGPAFERPRLEGVGFYAALCERMLGRRPALVQLLHLAEPVAISVRPDDHAVRAVERRASAVWDAVQRACEEEDFRPHPSRLCDWCAYREWCPAFGGDPQAAGLRLARG
jgi:putative RecB family exonuclease